MGISERLEKEEERECGVKERERERVKDDLLPLFVHQEYNNNIKKIKNKHKDKANLGQS